MDIFFILPTIRIQRIMLRPVIDHCNRSAFWYPVWESILKTAVSGFERAFAQPLFIDDWRPATGEPRHTEVAYCGSADQIASLDEQSEVIRDLQTMRIPENMTIEEL